MFLEFINTILCYIFGLFGYIKSEKLYPEPLSKTEEEYYLKKYFEGDKEAKNILIEHNLRLVVHIAKKYSQNEIDLEDYTSIGTIGLIKAINSFKSDKNYKISTYASKCIENEILMNIRSSKKIKSEISLNSIIGTDKDGHDMELLETLKLNDKDPNEIIYSKLIKKDLIRYINNNLNKRDKEIMILRYGLNGNNPKTQEEVAKILKISRSYVSRLESKIQKELKEKIKYIE